MDPYYTDLDADQTDLDISAGSSNLSFDLLDCAKSPMSPSHVTMFYPQLGYELHPLLMNQRKLPDSVSEKLSAQSLLTNDDFQVPTHHLVIAPPAKPTRSKPRTTRSAAIKEEIIPDMNNMMQSVPHETVDSVEKHRKTFSCRDCGKSFKFQTSLLRHNNKVHNCKYQCPTCHRVFSRQAYLDVHVSKPGSSCFVNCFPNMRPQRQPKIN